jgi:hypothetical protein
VNNGEVNRSESCKTCVSVSVSLQRPKLDSTKATETTQAVILKPADSASYTDESDR